MEATKPTISDPAEGLRYRLADAVRTQPVDLTAQLRAAVHTRLGIYADDEARSPRRGILGRRRKAAG